MNPDTPPPVVAELRDDVARIRTWAQTRHAASLHQHALAVAQQAEDTARRHAPDGRGGCTWCRDTWVCTELHWAGETTRSMLDLIDTHAAQSAPDPVFLAGFAQFIAWVASHHQQSTDAHLRYVVRELGEVFDAWDGSPRKSVAPSPEAAAAELGDVIMSAAVAAHHLAEHHEAPGLDTVLAATMRKIVRRLAGDDGNSAPVLPGPDQPPSVR